MKGRKGKGAKKVRGEGKSKKKKKVGRKWVRMDGKDARKGI